MQVYRMEMTHQEYGGRCQRGRWSNYLRKKQSKFACLDWQTLTCWRHTGHWSVLWSYSSHFEGLPEPEKAEKTTVRILCPTFIQNPFSQQRLLGHSTDINVKRCTNTWHVCPNAVSKRPRGLLRICVNRRLALGHIKWDIYLSKRRNDQVITMSANREREGARERGG